MKEESRMPAAVGLSFIRRHYLPVLQFRDSRNKRLHPRTTSGGDLSSHESNENGNPSQAEQLNEDPSG
jgi:hypothetical protein